MVLKDLKEVINKLKSVENINLSTHAEKKLQIRRIDKNLLIDNLRNPENLRSFSFEKDKYPGEKYKLYFSVTKRKSLRVVVSFVNEDINVVTAHIILSKRVKWVEKWRKKRL